MNITNLIERLEKATGPDREIDALIHVMLGASGFDSEWRYDTFKENISSWAFRNEIGRVCANYKIPHYTASIDAALTLMPNVRWIWCVWHEYGSRHGAMIKAPDLSQWTCVAPSPAIALSIVALKARASLNTTQGSDDR